MTLVVVHHHLRPGGVRRVIELATPQLVAHGPGGIVRVVLATGEAPDPAWLKGFRQRLPATPVEVTVLAVLGYVSESMLDARRFRRQVHLGIGNLLGRLRGENILIWAHNLGLGRNLSLAHELTSACQGWGIRLVMHHHDWWFENRWHHIARTRAAGFRTLRAVAAAILPVSPYICHVAINQEDAKVLRRHFPGRAGWLPNPGPMEPRINTTASHGESARAWLRQQLGEEGPVWLLPCRLLRRKNVAEALLLTRWLRPEAWFVTTGGVSSAEEQVYADALSTAARSQGWRLRLGVLSGNDSAAPTVSELLTASEAILLTSLQEGFGLTYLEAVAAQRPLLARRLPNIAPDLAQFGFRFPQEYREVWVDPTLFDWKREQAHQKRLFRLWKGFMPRTASHFAGTPALLAAGHKPCPVPFSRLSLTGQLEVLAQPVKESWERCAPLNPFLKTWRRNAANGLLKTCSWPRSAERWLSGCAYARRFFGLVPRPFVPAPSVGASQAAQAEFLRVKLQPENLYPLLWNSQT